MEELFSESFCWNLTNCLRYGLLIIPELNDQDLVLQQIAEWLSRLSTDIRIKLIVFRRHGLHPEHSDFAEATPERLEDVHVVFQSYGYQDIQVI